MLRDVVEPLVSHAQATGLFERVNSHQPRSAPGSGLRCAIWSQGFSPTGAASGLNTTSVTVTMNVRIYSDNYFEPQDQIDPMIMSAVDELCSAYSGDFDLGNGNWNIDLLGMYSQGLRAEAGYLVQDERVYRVMTISVPITVRDLWEQVK